VLFIDVVGAVVVVGDSSTGALDVVLFIDVVDANLVVVVVGDSS